MRSFGVFLLQYLWEYAILFSIPNVFFEVTAMMIAKRQVFEGKPVINTPEIFGASIGKEFIYRIPVIGKRPIAVSVETTESGFSINNGIIRGAFMEKKEFFVKIIAENDCGTAEKMMTVRIEEDGAQKTPLLGFTTWNAFGERVTQEDVISSAKALIESGLADYGYHYINLDSGWQEKYGGKYDAIMPNAKFPQMQKICDTAHSLGLRCGIYSTPMLTAWGCPAEFESIPGCTVGNADPNFPDTSNGGIGVVHKEANNVCQWTDWGFDYLKYDWSPAEAVNADLMKRELLKSKREFAFCITVAARIEDAEYWKKNVNSYRDNTDTHADWANVVERVATLEKWKDNATFGHYYDLDMLCMNGYDAGNLSKSMTLDEELFCYTMTAFFNSPIQISTPIEALDDVRLDMLCNEEIIAINQDVLADYPEIIVKNDELMIYRRKLNNGDVAYAVFNMTEKNRTEKILLDASASIRDVWMKRDVGYANEIIAEIEPHSAKVYRVHQ